MVTAAPSASLTISYTNPVIVATTEIFETMLDCTPTRTGLMFRETMTQRHDVNAVIHFKGKAVGAIVLSMSKRAALGVLNRLVGTKANGINSRVCDAVGELANMIAGASKAHLDELELTISVPTIVPGPDHNVSYPLHAQPICVVFESEIGPFAIEVGFVEV